MRAAECTPGLAVRLTGRGIPRQRTIDRAIAGEDTARVTMRLILSSEPATVIDRAQRYVSVRTRGDVVETTPAQLLCTHAEFVALLALLRRNADPSDPAMPAMHLLLRYYERLERSRITVDAYMGVRAPGLHLTVPVRASGRVHHIYHANADLIERALAAGPDFRRSPI